MVLGPRRCQINCVLYEIDVLIISRKETMLFVAVVRGWSFSIKFLPMDQ